MKVLRKTLPLVVLGFGLIVGLTLVTLRLPGGDGGPAQAQGPITVGFDMNTAGNSCPGTGAADCTLGTIDSCIEVPAGGGDITFDVFMDGLPAGGDFWAFGYTVTEKNSQSVGTITAFTHNAPLVNLLRQVAPLAALTDFSDVPPAPMPGWSSATVDLSGGLEANPPFTQGVLSRLTANIPGATPDGVYFLTLSNTILGDSESNDYCDPISPNYVGCSLLDGNATPIPHGMIAKGVSCPQPITVGFDMNTTGNSCPHDGTDCTLGTIDACVEVPTGGGVITVDVFLENLPTAAAGFAGFQYHIGEKHGLTVGTVAAITHNSTLINLIMQLPAVNLQDFSDVVGTSIPSWDGIVADLGNPEANPPFTKGVMSRLQINTTGRPDGIYGLTIDPPGTGAGLAVLNNNADDYCQVGSPAYVLGCNILDANDAHGLIAIGQACPLLVDAYIKSQQARAGDCSSSVPTAMPVNTDTDVCLHKILRQDDVATLDVNVTPDLATPGDCTATPKTGPSSVTLPQSTDVAVDEVYTINCSAPSTHAFTFNNTIDITTPGLMDTDFNNNIDTTPMSVVVTAQADVSVTSVTVNSPSTHSAALPFDVTVAANVANNGPYGPVTGDVTIDLDLTSAPGCTKNPSGSHTVQNLNLGSASPSATWSVTCATTGTKTFNGGGSVALDAGPHVTDPNPGNNSRLTPPGSDSTNVTPTTDVEAVSWTFPDDLSGIAGNQVIVVPGMAEAIQSTQVIINNGGTYTDPVTTNDDRTAADTPECDVAPNNVSASFDLAIGVPQNVVDNWTVTWTEMARPPYFCMLTFQTTLSITEPGVADYDGVNNTDSVDVILVRDSDGDTVVDDYDGIVDNCPDNANPGQADNDADGLGDVCDPDDDNDGFTDVQETFLGSNPLDPMSTPEHSGVAQTCFDGLDNDLDGLTDGYDPGCDYDADGIPNWSDACFALPEDWDGYQDADGCPDTDNDMDGVCDFYVAPPSQPSCTGSDTCPNVPEDVDSFHDTDGCPDPDNDGDGFPDHTDQCPATDWTAGPDGIADTGDEPHNESGVPIKTKEDYDGIIDVDGCHDSPGDDWDGDGIADEVEFFVAGTNPMDMDSDDDGLCDGSAPPVCGSEDLNNNGVVDPGETDPANPDTDGDGLTDGMESGLTQPETPGTNVFSPNWRPDSDPSTTTNPTSPDTDGDGLTDGVEDADHDGRTDPGETSPASADTDQDGHGDTADNCPALSNPGQEDFDADHVGDHCDDSDTDKFTDHVELFVGTDPLDACSDDLIEDVWPPDIKIDRRVSIADVIVFRPVMLTCNGDASYNKRFDLNTNGCIGIADVLKLRPVILTQCTNP